MHRIFATAAFALLLPVSASAVDFQFGGYADARMVFAPNNSDAYDDGGLGKARYGEDDKHKLHLTEILGSASAQFDEAWSATAIGRINPEYGPAVDLIEAYVRYQPVSTSPWRWSVQAGAFFPPISLENDQLGWQPFWTITPSAINSWIGAEIRIVGAQGSLEWRRDEATLAINGALFGFNDPMGVVIANRGWNFDDRALGLFDKYRLPDSLSAIFGAPPPFQADVFQEIDSRPGWYLDVSYEPKGSGFEVMTYDNNADPTKPGTNIFAWHTKFWDIGAYHQVGDLFTLMGQAMSGSTEVVPNPAFFTKTDFRAAYLLAGVDMDEWWFAARADVFDTRTRNSFGPSPLLSEVGRAGTLAANYAPEPWVRLSSEYLIINSTRGQRVLDGDPAHLTEHQLQFSVRIFF
ncbi:MAG TPA: hypothetical protein VHL34_17360 [Rhizomicrobium sp.]|jgi:hypothetical protein|nr:hypothetical protein [Rhizomicrobium sp.]